MTIQDKLQTIGDEIVKEIQSRIDAAGISHTGKLRNNITVLVNTNSIDIKMQDYAQFVNDGTRPHHLNSKGVQSIIAWAASKNLPPWGVITNISKYGTKPHPFLTNIDKSIDDIVKQNLNLVMNDINKEIYDRLSVSLKP